MRGRRPDARRAMLELFLDLRDAVRQEPVDRLLGAHAREARHQLAECAHSVRLSVRARVFEDELEHEVEERVGEIIRCLPSHLIYKSLDGIFKEWRVEKKGGR